MRLIVFLLMGLVLNNVLAAQDSRNNRLFIQAGYGLAGSFFVRSYAEPPPFPGYKEILKKNFIGSVQQIAVGVPLNDKLSFSFGLQYQHFTRHVQVDDVLSGVRIVLDHTIHHRDFLWHGLLQRNFMRRNNEWFAGFGLYYLRPKQEEIEIRQPNFFMNRERNFQNSRLEELGTILEAGYLYRFQPQVDIGVKTRFQYTLTAGYAESIALYPFINLHF